MRMRITARQIVKIVSVIASGIVIAVGVTTLYQTFFLPDCSESECRMRILELVDPLGTNSEEIHRYLSIMHRHDFDMVGIKVPGVILKMAEFDNVKWSNVDMSDAEFTCNRDDKTSNPELRPCAQLQYANFSGATLERTFYYYANLSHADFTNANMVRAQIHDSFLPHAVFRKSSLRGIRIENSILSDAEFDSDVKFRCTINRDQCIILKDSDFSSVRMIKVKFIGINVDRVDFTDANLSGAKFYCERGGDMESKCTILNELCVANANLEKTKFHDGITISNTNFSGANLERASFDGVMISNADFSGANLERASFDGVTISNADFSDAILNKTKFKNVQFENVVFPDQLVDAARFDDVSRKSLNAVQRLTLDHEDPEDMPCNQSWKRSLIGWQEISDLRE